MNARFKKILLLLLAAALLFGSGQVQQSLNRDRAKLNLTINTPLQNAPPLLAFTTVALGGFRGLISNYLWIRANDLQQDDKFFEAAQLANWITDLEPHFSQVWAFESWNMAFNISVKFKENAPGVYSDRWRWIENGINLLRDQGLRYNPEDVLLYRELAWLFQFKIGQNLDDGNMYYKQQLAQEMTPFFGPYGTNFAALVHPQTAEEKTNAFLFREKFKMDPALAQKVDERWGPLDWRLPEAHAIYWASLGLQKVKENPAKATSDDLLQLRRVIFGSLRQAFYHGRIIANPFTHGAELAPNLDIVQKASDAFLQEMKDDAKGSNNIANAHRYFIADAVYYFYENDRMAEAAKWFKYLGEKYPNKTILDNQPDSYPRNLTLDQYCVGRVEEDIGDTSQDRTTAGVQGMLLHSYLDLAIGQDARATGYQLLARKVYDLYEKKINKGISNQNRTGLPPFDNLKREVLNRLLDSKANMIPYAARAIIRTQLGLPVETNSVAPFSISTNAVAPVNLSPPTNSPATNTVE